MCLCQTGYRWGVSMEVTVWTASGPSAASLSLATGEVWEWRSIYCPRNLHLPLSARRMEVTVWQPRDLQLPLSARLQVRCENGGQYNDLGAFSCLCQPGYRWGVNVKISRTGQKMITIPYKTILLSSDFKYLTFLNFQKKIIFWMTRCEKFFF